MGARELQIDVGASLGIESLQGHALHAKLRAFARHKDLSKTGESSTPGGRGAITSAAHEPTLLEQYRKDPFAVRERIEREARVARAQMVGEWLSRIFV